MKKMMLTITCLLVSFMTITSCAVTGCDNKGDDKRLPLSSTTINIKKPFTGVINNTVVDVEFTQVDNTSVELLCPQGYEKYLEIMVDKGNLVVKFIDGLDKSTKNKLNRRLQKGKLYVSNAMLEKVRVNGSSKFNATGDLHTGALSVVLNGSGDINFNGVQSSSNLAVSLNGSGDVLFRREAKANNISINLNGSGDVNCTILTAGSVKAGVNGSGDIDIDEAVALKSSFVVNGSGDLEADNVLANNVTASIAGSGDIKLNGKCDNAELSVTSSGCIVAKNLEALKVKSSVVASGTVECNAQNELSATVTGSGEVKYRGNPDIKVASKNTRLVKIK